MNMAKSSTNSYLLYSIFLLSFFTFADSSSRWSWGRFGQIEPSNLSKDCNGTYIVKHLCPDNLIINSSHCAGQTGEPRVCCRVQVESSENYLNERSSELPKQLTSKNRLSILESVDESSYNSTTTAYLIFALQKNPQANNKGISNLQIRESTISQEDEDSNYNSEYTTQSTYAISRKQNETKLDSENEDYEIFSNKTETSLAAKISYRHPYANSFHGNREYETTSKTSPENWRSYDYDTSSKKKSPSITFPTNREVETFKKFTDKGNEEKTIDLKASENLGVVRYPSSYWNSNTNSRYTTTTTKSWKQPVYDSRNTKYFSRNHYKSTKWNDKISTTSSWIKPTKMSSSHFLSPSSTSKTTQAGKTDKVNTHRKPTRSLWTRSPLPLSSKKVVEIGTTQRTNLQRKPLNDATKNSRNISKTTPSFIWQPTKSSWQKEKDFEYSKPTTRTWRITPTTNNQRKTTRSTFNKQSTPAYSRKPPQTPWSREKIAESRRNNTEVWKTSATARNSSHKPSTVATHFNKSVTSHLNRASTKPSQSTRKPTVSTKPTPQISSRGDSVRRKSTPTYKGTTRPTSNNRRTSAEKYNTPTPLPNINSQVCGMRSGNIESNNPGTSNRRGNDPDAVIVYPESRESSGRRSSFQRIVGGKEAEPFSWPWVAAMYKVTSSGDNRFLCAGSLINENFVLTAAHVFTAEDLRSSSFVIMLGTHNAKEAIVEYAVMYVLRHPQYEQKYYYNDIALLRLERPVAFNDFVMPICLPSPSVPLWLDNDLVGKKVTVMGWGNEQFGGVSSRVLKEASFPIVSRNTCNSSYFQIASSRFPRGITNQMLCAGSPNGGKDACQGDSGGPLTTIENGRYTQVGIVSFGYKCGDKDYPGVYTKVSHYLSWIAEYARCDDNNNHDYRDYYG